MEFAGAGVKPAPETLRRPFKSNFRPISLCAASTICAAQWSESIPGAWPGLAMAPGSVWRQTCRHGKSEPGMRKSPHPRRAMPYGENIERAKKAMEDAERELREYFYGVNFDADREQLLYEALKRTREEFVDQLEALFPAFTR